MAFDSEHGPPYLYLRGISSFGHEACEQDKPRVYTRVSHFLEWIANNIKD